MDVFTLDSRLSSGRFSQFAVDDYPVAVKLFVFLTVLQGTVGKRSATCILCTLSESTRRIVWLVIYLSTLYPDFSADVMRLKRIVFVTVEVTLAAVAFVVTCSFDGSD